MSSLRNIGTLAALWAASLPLALANESGRTIGNGGDGVVLGRRTFALDLVEAGVHRDPKIHAPTGPSTIWEEELARSLNPSVYPNTLIVGKLMDLATVNASLALTLLRTIRLYNWTIVEPSLVNIPDEDTVMEIPDGELVQLAIRRNGWIRINQQTWRRLDAANQAALIFHEALYAMMPLIQVDEPLPGIVDCFHVMDETLRNRCIRTLTRTRVTQSSPDARIYVGFLFSHDFASEGGDNLVWPLAPVPTLTRNIPGSILTQEALRGAKPFWIQSASVQWLGSRYGQDQNDSSCLVGYNRCHVTFDFPVTAQSFWDTPENRANIINQVCELDFSSTEKVERPSGGTIYGPFQRRDRISYTFVSEKMRIGPHGNAYPHVINDREYHAGYGENPMNDER